MNGCMRPDFLKNRRGLISIEDPDRPHALHNLAEVAILFHLNHIIPYRDALVTRKDSRGFI